MSTDESRSSPQLTEYEQGLIEALRAERRRKLGADAPQGPQHPDKRAPVPPETTAAMPALAGEPPPSAPGFIQRVSAREPAPTHAPASGDVPRTPPNLPEKLLVAAESAAPKPTAPAEPVSTVKERASAAAAPPSLSARSTESRRPELDPRAVPPGPAPRRSRALWIVVGAVLAVALAAGALALLKSVRNPPKPAAAVTPPPALPRVPAAAEKKTPAPGETAAAELERAYANYRPDRSETRAELQAALANPALDSRMRESFMEVSGSRIRLRGAPTGTGPVLRTLRRGVYVRLDERAANGEWCGVSPPGGPPGWLKCNFLKPVGAAGPAPAGRP